MAGLLQLSVVLAVTTFRADAQEQPALGEAGNPFAACGVFTLERPISGELLAVGDTVIFTDDAGTVNAVDVGSRTLAWKAELGGTTASNLLQWSERIFFVTNSGGTDTNDKKTSQLREINPVTGLPSRSISLSSADRFHLAVSDEGLVIVGDDGSVILMSAASQEPVWRIAIPVEGPFHTTVSGGVLWMVNRSGIFSSISLSERKIIAQGSLGRDIRSIAADTEHGIFVSDNGGGVSRVASSEGRPSWKFKAGAAVTGIGVSKDEIYLTSLDNFVYKLSAGSGDVIWRRRVPNRVIIPAAIAENAIFVSGIGDDEVFAIDRSRGAVVNRLPLGENMTLAGPVILPGNGLLAVPLLSSITFFSEGRCGGQEAAAN